MAQGRKMKHEREENLKLVYKDTMHLVWVLLKEQEFPILPEVSNIPTATVECGYPCQHKSLEDFKQKADLKLVNFTFL